MCNLEDEDEAEEEQVPHQQNPPCGTCVALQHRLVTFGQGEKHRGFLVPRSGVGVRGGEGDEEVPAPLLSQEGKSYEGVRTFTWKPRPDLASTVLCVPYSLARL